MESYLAFICFIMQVPVSHAFSILPIADTLGWNVAVFIEYVSIAIVIVFIVPIKQLAVVALYFVSFFYV